MRYKTDVIVLNHLGGGMSVRVHKLPAKGESVMGYDWRLAEDVAKGGNVAIALSRLGFSSALIGKVGRDVPGDRDVAWLKADNVNVDALIQTDEVQTGQGIVFIDDNGDNMIVTGESSSKALTLDEVKDAIAMLSPARFFVGGFEVRKPLVLDAAKIAKAAGMQTVLNPSPVPGDGLEAVDYIDYFFVNEVEGKLLLGIGPDAEYDPRDICFRLAGRYRPGCVILTMGADGSAGCAGDRYWTIDPVNVTPVDPSGAGDGYLAAVVACLMWGMDIEVACRWASIYGAYTVTIADCIPAYPTRAQLAAFKARHGLA
ncbi:MAG: PfkB family carbohydrate kinase [Planctomycetaceae bacterium]|nr:PfkB family carbohydrate kinase [Planctomycetaceae bacterium]